MRDKVTIDGIELTRAQLKEAWEMLEAPKRGNTGDVIEVGTELRYLVVDKDQVREVLRKLNGDQGICINEHGRAYSYSSGKVLKKQGAWTWK